MAHRERFASFSAFIATVLTNYDNQQKAIEATEEKLKTAGEVTEKGLSGLQNEAKDTTELRYFFYNILMDALKVDPVDKKAVNMELIGDRDRQYIIELFKGAVPEFRQREVETAEPERLGYVDLMDVLDLTAADRDAIKSELLGDRTGKTLLRF